MCVWDVSSTHTIRNVPYTFLRWPGPDSALPGLASASLPNPEAGSKKRPSARGGVWLGVGSTGGCELDELDEWLLGWVCRLDLVVVWFVISRCRTCNFAAIEPAVIGTHRPTTAGSCCQHLSALFLIVKQFLGINILFADFPFEDDSEFWDG